MRTFLNRLYDRGWKVKGLRGYTDNNTVVLQRGGKNILVVDNINIDPSVDILPQVDEFFKRLIEIIKRSNSTEVFLPGGGDIAIPDFFRDFCLEHNIRVHVITIESYRDFSNYN
jgi:hypothetical protein